MNTANGETRQSKAIFPNTWNANETLFGGEALKWMDEVAYITATRYTRQKMFTVKIEEIQFKKPAYKVSFVEVIGKVVEVSAVKLKVLVEMFVEDMYSDESGIKAVEGIFVFAALGENRRPQRVRIKE
ncbi:acyl-CoA thioesterase [Haoranjiania flava]|uniref:Acyl-CoA thioesterase n=1 Tax=Haoranjiania flava TaxID=1856322 RepID=A0AAE3IQ04_9BACT|nr:hotdog domain-containing protein [Haoranjiania flava]MCU7693692.1 acyl-CoA thioesterase [Haoranjiania flava]